MSDSEPKIVDPRGQSIPDRYHTQSPFPTWLREMIAIGSVLITVAAFGFNLSSEQRSTREEVARLSADLTIIKQSLPNKELFEEKIRLLNVQIEELRSDMKFEAAKTQNLRERLIQKGWVE